MAHVALFYSYRILFERFFDFDANERHQLPNMAMNF